MKSKLLLSALLVITPAFATTPLNYDGEYGIDEPRETGCGGALEALATKDKEAVKRHPLRGVVTAVLPEKSALMVKHEDIPGVMRAMTMMFKVDEATLKSVQKGQAITGMLSRQGDEWWLHEVKVAAGQKN